MGYRPWGLLDWLIPRCAGTSRWALLGCLSTGERSLAAWRILKANDALSSVKLLRIKNKKSRHDAAVLQRENERLAEFLGEGGRLEEIESHELLEHQSKIIDVVQGVLSAGNPNVILDVSTLPKRFFFPFLKLLLKDPVAIPNLLVTYSSPLGYTNEKLAENFDQWDHLPLFSGAYTTAEPKMMIVNVGFEGFGLQEQVDHAEAHLPIKLLVPFPTPPQASKRTWELVRRLQKYRNLESFQTYLTDARDVGEAFDRLISLTGRGTRPAILAPFGPKSLSVAMALFATRTESQVFYTQPTVYHPQYSYGVNMIGGASAVWAYCIRLNGREYYDL